MKLKITNDDLAHTIVEKEDLKKNLSDVSQQCKEANIKNHKLEEEVYSFKFAFFQNFCLLKQLFIECSFIPNTFW